jgi:hypothetical protein
MILVIKNRKWLCNDSCWREFAPFGTLNWCIKQYKYKRSALNRFYSKEHPYTDTSLVKIIEIPKEYRIDMSGNVFSDEVYFRDNIFENWQNYLVKV